MLFKNRILQNSENRIFISLKTVKYYKFPSFNLGKIKILTFSEVKNSFKLKLWTFSKLVKHCETLCGNFMIFLSFRFYVKSILANLNVVKLPFSAILVALNFVNLVDFSLLEVKKIIKIKNQSLLKSVQNFFADN